MDFITFFLALSAVICASFYVLRTSSSGSRKLSNLPPGPTPLPIIGNLLQLGPNPHQSLAKLSETYGTLMYLKLGSKHTIVVSSPEMAKEVLQKHDQFLSARPRLTVTRVHEHHKASVAWLSVGSTWRVLRKICKEHMFSQQRLDSSQSLRQEKLHKLRDYVEKCSESCSVVNIADVAFNVSLDLISASLFSIDFDSESSRELRGIVRGMFQVVGKPNLADYFPVLQCIDPQGLERKSAILVGKMMGKFDDIIQQRLQLSDESRMLKDDLLEVLLEISGKNESEFTRDGIPHLLLDLFMAGTETTTTTVEWAMAELIHNPNKMAKAKRELQSLVGKDSQIEESDISRLPYLQAVLKEIFRLHPPGPLLIPHKAEVSVEMNGYMIPKDSEILVNIWATNRNPRLWPNPDSFDPERFLDSKVDVRGQDFDLIPFGSGRRICPGLPLAYRMVHLMVASLIHNFDWKLEGGMKPEAMDMTESFEFSLQKAVPLKAIPSRA